MSWKDGWLVVFGAVIAALAGVIGPLVVQARDEHRIDRREAQTARGAARVILAGFGEAKRQMVVLERDRILRPIERPKRVVLPQVVAEKLGGDTWGRAQNALTNIAALANYVKMLIAGGRHRLKDAEACFVRADLAAFGDTARIFGAMLADAASNPPRRPSSVNCGGSERPY